MSLEAGRLRHRINLWALSTAQDPATGEQTETYALSEEDVRAEFVPLSAREFITAQASQSQIVGRVTIRYRDGVKATSRLEFRGTMYNIVGVLPDPDSGKEYLTLSVSQV